MNSFITLHKTNEYKGYSSVYSSIIRMFPSNQMAWSMSEFTRYPQAVGSSSFSVDRMHGDRAVQCATYAASFLHTTAGGKNERDDYV